MQPRLHPGGVSRAQRFFRRVVGAALLEPAVYEDVEADRTATGSALLVVLLSSLATGVGARGWDSGASEAILFFIGISAIALLVWAAWPFLIFEIGTRLLPTEDTRSDVGELLRTLGFAASPGLIRICGALPGARAPVFILSALWMLAAMVVAVRQALDYRSTARAIAVCGIGGLLSIVLAITVGLLFGPVLLGA